MARTIREMGNQINSAGPSHSHTGLMGHGSDSEPLWKFLDFIAMHRSPLYTLLLPFIHTRARMPADNEQERTFQLCAKVAKQNVKKDYTMVLFSSWISYETRQIFYSDISGKNRPRIRGTRR